MIEIDGATHSGSGAIVRYSVALATLLGWPVRIRNIRASRDKPGLRPQHLWALRACSRICSGRLEGGEVGSREIEYHPGPSISSGDFSVDVGTAGSTTLLAFTLMIPALFSSGPSKFRLTGGLFQDFAPSPFHMRHCLFPLLERMGASVQLEVERPGYYPKGQGRLVMEVQPCRRPLTPLSLLRQGSVGLIRGFSLASNLRDLRVAERMAAGCRNVLEERGCKTDVRVMDEDSAVQKGAALMVWTETDTGALIGSDMAGAPGRESGRIGKSVARNLIEDLRTGAAVDRHLADQVIIFAALAKGTTSYKIPEITDHVRSNLWLAEKILGARSEVAENVVTVHGVGFSHGVSGSV